MNCRPVGQLVRRAEYNDWVYADKYDAQPEPATSSAPQATPPVACVM